MEYQKQKVFIGCQGSNHHPLHVSPMVLKVNDMQALKMLGTSIESDIRIVQQIDTTYINCCSKACNTEVYYKNKLEGSGRYVQKKEDQEKIQCFFRDTIQNVANKLTLVYQKCNLKTGTSLDPCVKGAPGIPKSHLVQFYLSNNKAEILSAYPISGNCKGSKTFNYEVDDKNQFSKCTYQCMLGVRPYLPIVKLADSAM